MRVRTPETGSGRMAPGEVEPERTPTPIGQQHAAGSVLAVLTFAVSLAVYVAVYCVRARAVRWYDLNVYNDAGLIARSQDVTNAAGHVIRGHPSILYSWQFFPNVKFTYTPFAAMVFAATSELAMNVLHWGMTVLSLAAIPLVVGLTFGALGWRGKDRLTVTFVVSAFCLWLEPVLRALELGQIELVLMALIVWDLSQDDRRVWKGAGVGVAAGIKMIPLVFIPYLVLCGKIRQAAVATGAVVATIAIGFIGLPHESVKWWLTGYFLHTGNVGDVGSLVNQSVFALITRAVGGATPATPVWLVVSLVIGVAGLGAGAVLHRRGRPVEGWVTCAITGLLISPISWDHHWVWAVPALIILIDRAVRARGQIRAAYGALALAVALLFGGWPSTWTGRYAYTVHYGLIGFFVGVHPQDEIYQLHGIQLISWNLFIVAGLVMLAVAVIAAARAWRAGKTTGSTTDNTAGSTASSALPTP